MAIVSSVGAKLRKTVSSTNPSVATEEETSKRKKLFLSVLDKTIQNFLDNLEKGLIPINSTLDLERIVKLTLLISGEADSRTGQEPTQEEIEAEVNATNTAIALEEIRTMIKNNDPVLDQLYSKLFTSLNDNNDQKG